MKISTKFNFFVGLFFFVVIMAVLYSYCGGLSVCYSFPFLNGIGRGSVPNAKVMMTSYIIDEKEGESRDDGTNAIYFYSKAKDNSNRLQKISHMNHNMLKERTRKPGDEENILRKKTGSSSRDPPSVITGKVAEGILKKANISLEESNRKLFREEKVDKQVDREDSIQIKTNQTQSTPITKDRGDLGTRILHPNVHPIRKPPRKLRKRLKIHRVNRLTKQDRIDRALEKKLERKEELIRMRGDGRVNQSYSLRKQRHSHVQIKNPIKDSNKMTINEVKLEKKNYANEAVSPLDTKDYRNEALTDTKMQENEAKLKNGSSSPKIKGHRSNTPEHSTHQSETKQLQREMQNSKKREKIYQPQKVALREKTAKPFITGQKYKISQKIKTDQNTFIDVVTSGGHDNEMTSSGVAPLKRNEAVKSKSVTEGSGSGEDSRFHRYKTVSAGDLIRSIRNIRDENTKQALQSAIHKDEKQLQVIKLKNSNEEKHRSFNLTNVLKELVRAAESNEVTMDEFPRYNQGLIMRRRNSDKPLVRVKRLRNIRQRNKASERTLVRVKRIEDDVPRDSGTDSDRQLIRVKRLDDVNNENVRKMQKSYRLNIGFGQKKVQKKQIISARRHKFTKEEQMLKQPRLKELFDNEKLKNIEQNKKRNTTMTTSQEGARRRGDDLKQGIVQVSKRNYNEITLPKEMKTNGNVNTSKNLRNSNSKSKKEVGLVRVKRLDLDDE